MSPATAHAPTTRGLGAATSCDQTLMERLAAGDPDAFEELYRRHYRRVLMQATKLCASRELAEEVAQETLLALWRGARLYRPELGSVSAWLSGMVRNRAIDAWRRAASRPTEVEICDEGGGQLEGASVTDAQGFERAAVLSLVADLPHAQKEAVFLAYFGELTHAEIATRTREPLGTVKSRIRLGIDKLRGGAAAAGMGYERALPA